MSDGNLKYNQLHAHLLNIPYKHDATIRHNTILTSQKEIEQKQEKLVISTLFMLFSTQI